MRNFITTNANAISNVRAQAGRFSYGYFYYFTEGKNRHAVTER